MDNSFNLCPKCSSKNIEYKDKKKWFCPDCGFDLYNNVAAAVGIVIKDKDNNVLFEVRQKDPKKGFLAIPGGFIDYDETAEEACKRECMEEIGLEVQKIKYIASFPNTYVYKNIEYKTCDIFFMAEFDDDLYLPEFIKNLKIQESEVQSLVCHKINSLQDIEKLPIAFESTKKTLSKIIKN